jgi:predicted transposase/invertase (TIGR01784 family)
MHKLVRFDWAIKYLLRHKANFDILEGFLSELLHIDIRIEAVLESESNKETAQDKYNRVDVLVTTGSGEKIIIEVQCQTQWDYLSRVLYGTSKVICEYLKEGTSYQAIQKVISISIVYFNLGEGKDYLYRGRTTFKGLHYQDALVLNKNEKALYAKEREHTLEEPRDLFPEYYIIKIPAFHEKIQDKLDEWIYFLKNGEIKPEFQAKGLVSAANKLNVLKLNEKERRQYAAYKEASHDNASFDAMLEIREEQARAAGRTKGIKEVALGLLLKNIAPAIVAEVTGLTLQEIAALKK